MQSISVSRTVDATVSQTWDAIDDFGCIARFHPLIERSPITNGRSSGVGAERECHFYAGGHIKERVVAVDPERSTEIEFLEFGPFPMTRARARFDLRPADGGRTDVTFTMRYTPKFGPLGVLMAKTVMGVQLRKAIAGLLDGLDAHLRTGRTVGPKGVLEAA